MVWLCDHGSIWVVKTVMAHEVPILMSDSDGQLIGHRIGMASGDA